MSMQILGRVAGAVVLTLGLAGCIDATIDVAVTGADTAKGTMTTTIDKSIYDMGQSGEDSSTSKFCEGGEVTIAGEKVTCVQVKEGSFADVTFDGGDSSQPITFTEAGPGLVRVAYPTKDLMGELGTESMDAETKAMMISFFSGHSVTFRISGKEVTDTNMTLSEDSTSAERVIPFLELIEGTAELPEELYAVVRAE